MSYSAAFSQALEVLFYIELKTKLGDDRYLTIQSISDTLNIPVPSIKKLIGLLKKADLVDSKKGVKGGLALNKVASNIQVYDVFKAIEGETSLFKQYQDFDVNQFIHRDEASYMLNESRKLLMSAEDAMLKELKKKTLADFFDTK